MEILLPVYIAVFGLIFGSFLNVVIYRVPRNTRFLAGRSYCPHCKQQLRWYHNIPVASYLALGGKCAFCHERIPARYPLVEVINAGLYVFFYWQFGLSTSFFVYSALASALLAIFFIDIEFQIIPDVITLPGIVVGLAISFVSGDLSPLGSLIGMTVGGGALFLMALIGDWLFKKESMGGGDIKMAAMLGAFLGWQKVVFIFIASAAIGLAVSLIIMALSKKIRQSRTVPFGPFLSIAAIVAITYGERIISFYLTSFVYPH